MNIDSWNAMLVALEATPEQACFAELVTAYAEAHRAYHTGRHISDCLSLLTEFRTLTIRPAECECAIWFHDAIYDPMSKTNEERSADWAAAFLANARVNAASIERIRRHILATRHAEEPEDPDSKLVVDIDLGILGSDPGRYDEFERQVRREYKWVPGPLYRRVRAEILRSFLDRSVIYSHMPLRERFEAQARENLTRSLQRLAGRE